jgi:sulfite dehydrogenase (cytochrome) subunit B
MNPVVPRLVAGAFVLLSAASARAEENVTLKPDSGRDAVESYCGACHSLQYLPENGFLNRQGWESEVTKMIKAFGAPIESADAKVIVDYLSANYSSGN